MAQPPEASNRSSLARGFAGVTAAVWLANILSYLLLLIAARQLGVDDYGELVTLLNLLLIGSVPSFALQAVGARHVATGNSDGLLRATAAIALTATVAMALIAPLLVEFLHLPEIAGPLLVAVTLPGVAVQGLCQGFWQGRQDFPRLALLTFLGVVGRSAAGMVGLLIGGTATWTAAAIAVGTLATAAGGLAITPLRWSAGGPTPTPTGREPVAAPGLRAILVESGHASHAYGVFLLLSVTDVLLARHVLNPTSAAVYAAGSVLTKGALWLPQSVANVLFASLTDHDRHRSVFLRAAAGVAGLGALLTAFCWLVRGVVTAVVGGQHYPQLEPDLWLFAVLGSCLALLQFTLVAGLAVRSAAVTALAWLAIVLEVVVVLVLIGHPSVRAVIGSVCLINLAACVAAVALRGRPGLHGGPRAGAGSGHSLPGHGPATKLGS